ncbi:hypothetical protein ES703_58785 [subsurface metagenome]
MYFTDSGVVVIALAWFINLGGFVFIIGLALGTLAMHYLDRKRYGL